MDRGRKKKKRNKKIKALHVVATTADHFLKSSSSNLASSGRWVAVEEPHTGNMGESFCLFTHNSLEYSRCTQVPGPHIAIYWRKKKKNVSRHEHRCPPFVAAPTKTKTNQKNAVGWVGGDAK